MPALFNDEVHGSLVRITGSSHGHHLPHHFAVRDVPDGEGGRNAKGDLPVRHYTEQGGDAVLENVLSRTE